MQGCRRLNFLLHKCISSLPNRSSSLLLESSFSRLSWLFCTSETCFTSQRYSALRTTDIQAHNHVADETVLGLEVCYFKCSPCATPSQDKASNRLDGLSCALCGDYRSHCFYYLKELHIGLQYIKPTQLKRRNITLEGI